MGDRRGREESTLRRRSVDNERLKSKHHSKVERKENTDSMRLELLHKLPGFLERVPETSTECGY